MDNQIIDGFRDHSHHLRYIDVFLLVAFLGMFYGSLGLFAVKLLGRILGKNKT